MSTVCIFFFSSRRRHTRYWRDWSSDVCSSDLEVAEDGGEYGKAAAFYQESLALYREVEDKEGIALMARHLGRIARIQGDYGRAATMYDESLILYEELGGKLGIAHALEGMAALRTACGQPGPATRFWAAAEALREEIGAPLE